MSKEKPYVVDYLFNGHKYGTTVYATSWEEAQRHVAAIGRGKVVGELNLTIRVGWLGPIHLWMSRTLKALQRLVFRVFE